MKTPVIALAAIVVTTAALFGTNHVQANGYCHVGHCTTVRPTATTQPLNHYITATPTRVGK